MIDKIEILKRKISNLQEAYKKQNEFLEATKLNIGKLLGAAEFAQGELTELEQEHSKSQKKEEKIMPHEGVSSKSLPSKKELKRLISKDKVSG